MFFDIQIYKILFIEENIVYTVLINIDFMGKNVNVNSNIELFVYANVMKYLRFNHFVHSFFDFFYKCKIQNMNILNKTIKAPIPQST